MINAEKIKEILKSGKKSILEKTTLGVAALGLSSLLLAGCSENESGKVTLGSSITSEVPTTTPDIKISITPTLMPEPTKIVTKQNTTKSKDTKTADPTATPVPTQEVKQEETSNEIDYATTWGLSKDEKNTLSLIVNGRLIPSISKEELTRLNSKEDIEKNFYVARDKVCNLMVDNNELFKLSNFIEDDEVSKNVMIKIESVVNEFIQEPTVENLGKVYQLIISCDRERVEYEENKFGYATTLQRSAAIGVYGCRAYTVAWINGIDINSDLMKSLDYYISGIKHAFETGDILLTDESTDCKTLELK